MSFCYLEIDIGARLEDRGKLRIGENGAPFASAMFENSSFECCFFLRCPLLLWCSHSPQSEMYRGGGEGLKRKKSKSLHKFYNCISELEIRQRDYMGMDRNYESNKIVAETTNKKEKTRRRGAIKRRTLTFVFDSVLVLGRERMISRIFCLWLDPFTLSILQICLTLLGRWKDLFEIRQVLFNSKRN